ncbi:MAG: class II fructose-bisphosphate aldolase [Victivallales bacterium]|nr:class II fructose-bisphosphate aldolase [Victivallales bacterium]
MALVPMLDLLRPAREKGYALPAFECWNSASIYGAVAAAAEGGFPLILQASPLEYGTMGGADVLRRIAELYANRFGVTMALHLDHGSTLEHAQECIEAGFTSVMLDASTASFEENAALSRSVVEKAHPKGITVEAELGHVGVGADGATAESNDWLTVPEEAEHFVKETGIDCLAVAIGTIHGEYRSTPKLRLERLKAIASLVKEPLVLHGGSGTPWEQLRQAIALGISKINICTDLNKAYLHGINAAQESLNPGVPGIFYRQAHEEVKKKVLELTRRFSGQAEWN